MQIFFEKNLKSKKHQNTERFTALIILHTDGGSGSRCKTLWTLAEESPGAAGQDTAEARGPQGYGKRRREKTALRRGRFSARGER